MDSQPLNATRSQLVGGPGYAPLTEGTVREFLMGLSRFADLLDGPVESWTVREVGDGNLNLLFVVR